MSSEPTDTRMRSGKEPLVAPSIGRVRFDAGKAIWLWGMAVPGLVIGIPALTPTTLIGSLVLTFLTLCVGHSVGLHRGAIHRTYEAGPVVRGILAYLFVLSGLGGPLSWARLHAVRDFWQNRSDCPRYFAYDHSIARDFVWNLHLRFEPADPRTDDRLPADLLRDPWLRFLERTWPLHIFVLAIAILVTLGPEAVAVYVCARTAAGILGHWAVGYAAHAWGERRFIVPGAKESGTNVWILGLVSFGEGFHNNHHAFPTSARMGMRARELDLGWIVICVLEKLRLVRQVSTWHRVEPSRATRADSETRHHDLLPPAGRKAARTRRGRTLSVGGDRRGAAAPRGRAEANESNEVALLVTAK